MIEVETPQEIEVVSNGIDVEARSLDVEAVDLKELDVTVAKREFVITGDDIYVPKLYDDAPQWMKDLVQLVVNSAMDTGNASTLAQLTSMLSQFATSYVPLNQYTQSILDLSNANTSIHTVIETLNSNYSNGLSQANAQIISLQNTKASKDEVVTQVVNTLAAQLANPTSSLGAAIGNLQQTIVDNQNANALSMQTLTASLEDVSGDVSSNATVVNNALAYVGINSAGASTGTGLSAYVQGSNGQFGSAGSGINNQISVAATGVESKWAYNSSLNINGTSYNSGFGLSNSAGTGAGSEFWINADKLKFTNNGKTGSKAPFTIDANGPQPEITFNGKVTFGSGQTGTIDEAIAAVVETVAVGDKNINITDNLIPTTSLVADTDNSGYQFVGTPTKSMSAGLESFSEAQIDLDGSDEVYSPYVDEVTIPYYYRFGIKGITDLNRFKIVTINSSNVVSYNDVTLTMESGQSLSAGSWYTVDGIINPTGGTTTADGDIRDINGVKVGSINNFVVASGTTKILLGWIANCTISRMKMCKITADTITSDFSSVNGQLTNLQSQMNNVSWNTLNGKDVFAQEQGFANYADMVNKYTSLGKTIINGGYINTGLVNANSITANSISADRLMAGTNGATVWTNGGLVSQNFNGNVYGNIGNPTSGFRLSSGAAGTSADPNIYGAYIKGGVIQGSTFIGSLTETTVFNNFNAPAPGSDSWKSVASFTAYAPSSGESFKLTACTTVGADGGNWPIIKFKVLFNGVEVLSPVSIPVAFSGGDVTVFIKSSTNYTANVYIEIQGLQSANGFAYPQTYSRISCMALATAV